jgi:1-acyl-sn-glycerol-3-phosphate acyltransferase
MYIPTIADCARGSAALRRRQMTIRALALGVAKVELLGVENLPTEGPVVLAVNHRDYLDGPLLFGFLPRPVNFLVKIEAFTPLAGPCLRTTGSIAVIRSRPDPGAVLLSLRLLRAGGIVGVFPEGARGDGLVRTARPGVGYFALRTGATVVPVACHGTHLLAKRRGLARPLARLAVGERMQVGHVPWGQPVPRSRMLEATEEIRVALAKLVVDTSPAPVQGNE